jgi:hypothetical protein
MKHVEEFLGRFGLHIERRQPARRNVEEVNTRSAFGAIFDRNARDQAADSFFFSRGQRQASLPNNSDYLRDGFAGGPPRVTNGGA